MKDYPLINGKWKNWSSHYLTDLNYKIWALKKFSDQFLTNYTKVQLILDKITLDFVDEDKPREVFVFDISSLSFHQYVILNQDVYIKTQESDPYAIPTHTQGVYRLIPAGTTIVSNARSEGVVDQTDDTFLEDVDSYLLLGADENSEEIYLLVDEGNGSITTARLNLDNYLFQPTGFLGAYLMTSKGSSIEFKYDPSLGETYGNSLSQYIVSGYQRFTSPLDYSVLKQASRSWYVPAFTKDGDDITKNIVDVGDLTWIDKDHPVMSFVFENRTETDYGEEVIADTTWEIQTLQSTGSLAYSLLIKNDQWGTTQKDLQVEVI